MSSLKTAIAKKSGVKLEEITFYVHGKTVLTSDDGKTIKDMQIKEDSKDVTFRYRSYKNIVFAQNAMGVWTSKLYSFLKQTNFSEL